MRVVREKSDLNQIPERKAERLNVNSDDEEPNKKVTRNGWIFSTEMSGHWN